MPFLNEPDLASCDNSIYVTVAIQAMSIEDVDTTFPSMSSKLYGDLQSTFQIDGGASLTAISESKAKELHCKLLFPIMLTIRLCLLLMERLFNFNTVMLHQIHHHHLSSGPSMLLNLKGQQVL